VNAIAESDLLPLGKQLPAIHLSHSVAAEPGRVMVHTIGIVFYKVADGMVEPLRGGALKVVHVARVKEIEHIVTSASTDKAGEASLKSNAELKGDGYGSGLIVSETCGYGKGDVITAVGVLDDRFVEHGCEAVAAGGFESGACGEDKSVAHPEQSTGMKEDVAHFATSTGGAHEGNDLHGETNGAGLPDVNAAGESTDIRPVEIVMWLVAAEGDYGMHDAYVTGDLRKGGGGCLRVCKARAQKEQCC
jgi:hypothetical protein